MTWIGAKIGQSYYLEKVQISFTAQNKAPGTHISTHTSNSMYSSMDG